MKLQERNMRLRRVSEELENDYNKRRKISGIGTTFFLAITAVIIILIVIGIIPLKSELVIILPTVSLMIMIQIYSYYSRLKTQGRRILSKENSKYFDINEHGISIEVTTDYSVEDKIYTWNKLNTIDGQFINLGFSKKNPVKYKIGIISDGNKRELPYALRSATTLRQMRKAVKENKELLDAQERDFEFYGVIVEMYDDMAAEIKKYWKKESK